MESPIGGWVKILIGRRSMAHEEVPASKLLRTLRLVGVGERHNLHIPNTIVL